MKDLVYQSRDVSLYSEGNGRILSKGVTLSDFIFFNNCSENQIGNEQGRILLNSGKAEKKHCFNPGG